MLFDFFHANYHVIGHELVRTKEFMDNSWQFVFLFCCVSSVLPFFYLFFSASALFPPFSLFFLSEAVFYFLLYSETPQWDVSTSFQHIQTTKTTKDNIEQLFFCSIVPCCLLLSYVVWFFHANYHELAMNFGAHQFMVNYMVIQVPHVNNWPFFHPTCGTWIA